MNYIIVYIIILVHGVNVSFKMNTVDHGTKYSHLFQQPENTLELINGHIPIYAVLFKLIHDEVLGPMLKIFFSMIYSS